MAPKKAAVTETETPLSEPSLTKGKEKKPDSSTVRKLKTHPTTVIMIVEAIKALDSRKGVSSQAIQSYIKQQYPSVDPARLKGLVRKALKKGLENGTLVRPANATAATGATGRFKVAKKDQKQKSENLDPNVQKAPKAEKEGANEEPKKKKPAAKKEDKDKSEEPKPAKKLKKDKASTSKAAPVKKPGVAENVQIEETEHSETVKSKGKAKAVKGEKEKPEKAVKAQKEKSKATTKSDETSKAQGKRGKKSTE